MNCDNNKEAMNDSLTTEYSEKIRNSNFDGRKQLKEHLIQKPVKVDEE